MKRFAWILLCLCFLLMVAGGARSACGQASGPQAGQFGPSTGKAQSPPPPATYSLTQERRAKAIAYSRSLYILYFVGTLVSIGINLFLLLGGIAARFRDWARRASQRHFVQCLIFVPLFLAAATLLSLPLEFYSGYLLEHRFGLSTQGLVAWFGDWGISLGIGVALGVFVVWIFYWVVRRSPRRWWFYFWLTSIPLVLGYILIEPYVIDPLYYKFTPLEQTQPALVGRIEGMMNHAGIKVPPERIFEMNASSRTKAVDAYVTGLGASKRVVVWDTTLKTMGPDELLLILGHETGHYVLHHIPKEFALDEGVALLIFFLGFIAANRLLGTVGPRGGVEGASDIASLPLMLVVLTLMVFFSAPLVNAISRHYEHQADQFGLEVAYGVVPNPNAAEVESLQILGNEDLADPDPNPFIQFWLYTHPPLEDRIRFAASYHPWAEGKPLELLPSRQ